MMKRISICLFASVILTILITSCAIKILPGDELTETEKEQVINRARVFIDKINHLNISRDDKEFVKMNIPKFHANYVGHKRGAVKVFWKINPSYSIRVIYNGNLLDADCPVRLSISRFKM